MLTLAVRNLWSEPTRLAISAGGVAFAETRIVLIQGLSVAYQMRVAEYVDGAEVYCDKQSTPRLHTPTRTATSTCDAPTNATIGHRRQHHPAQVRVRIRPSSVSPCPDQ
jgi:hypothetical protein